MPGPAPKRGTTLHRQSFTVTMLAGSSTVNSADLGMGSLVGATVLCSPQQAAPDATAVDFSAVGNANGTVTVKAAVNATANVVIGVSVYPS